MQNVLEKFSGQTDCFVLQLGYAVGETGGPACGTGDRIDWFDMPDGWESMEELM